MKALLSGFSSFGSLTALLSLFFAAGCTVSPALQSEVQSDDARETESACSGSDSKPGSAPFSKLYGGNHDEQFNAMQQTSDGTYILAGFTTSFGASESDYDYNAWLVEVDAKGQMLWQKTLGGSDTDHANGVQQTRDGGFIVAGWTASSGEGMGDGWLIKTDRSGNKLWEKTFGGMGADVIYAVRQVADGGYVLAGETESTGDGQGDAWLIKTDAQGRKVWEKTFSGRSTGSYTQDRANALQETADGGFILAGFTTVSFPSGTTAAAAQDGWLIKTDKRGNKLWDRTFGGTGENENDYANAVQQTSDGGYILAGRTNSFSVAEPDVLPPDDGWLVKTDARGRLLWQKTFGGTGDETANAVQQTEDGGYILAGASLNYATGGGRSAWLVKTDADGERTWARKFGGQYGMDEARAVQQTKNGGYVLAGVYSPGVDGGADAWLVRTNAKGNAPKTPTR